MFKDVDRAIGMKRLTSDLFLCFFFVFVLRTMCNFCRSTSREGKSRQKSQLKEQENGDVFGAFFETKCRWWTHRMKMHLDTERRIHYDGQVWIQYKLVIRGYKSYE